MRSAAFSAIMMTAALILPPTRSGITDASTTRSASTPRTRSSPSTTAISSDSRAHPASAKRMMRGDGGGADMRVECRVRPVIRSRRDFGRGEGPKRRLPADVTRQAKTRPQRRGITVGGKEVLHDPHWRAGIGRGEIRHTPGSPVEAERRGRQIRPHRARRKAADRAKPSSAPRRTGTARPEAWHRA